MDDADYFDAPVGASTVSASASRAARPISGWSLGDAASDA
jgi:hypothetical protein